MEMKEVVLGDPTGHWIQGIVHGVHVQSEHLQLRQELRVYNVKVSAPEEDKSGKVWFFEQQSIILPVKRWVVLPPVTQEVVVKAKGSTW